MASCLPVVATTLAAEGMSLTNGENILVADSADDFANAVEKIYQDEVLWTKVSQNGFDFAGKTWSADAAWETFSIILGELGFNSVRGNKQFTLHNSN